MILHNALLRIHLPHHLYPNPTTPRKKDNLEHYKEKRKMIES